MIVGNGLKFTENKLVLYYRIQVTNNMKKQTMGTKIPLKYWIYQINL